MLCIMKTLSCREAGFDCDYIIQGKKKKKLFRNGGQHALNDHGIRREDFTPKFNEKLRGLIRDI
mgnify:CR=1 FL=1